MKLLYKYYFFAFAVLTMASSCNLDLYPETQLSDAAFWKTPEDIKNACNYMYPFLPDMLTNLTYANYADDGVSSGAANQISDGSRLAPGTDSDWDNSYALIRVANNILEKSADVTGAEAERYRGEARFFRAWANFELVKRFGDVPLILRTFDVFDTLTVAHRTNREKVLDTVYADLDNAIATLPDVSNLPSSEYGRITSGAALALKARIGLFEGTRNKFHGTRDAEKHLNIALHSSEILINAATYSLYENPQSADTSYHYLFLYEGERSSENILVRLYGANAANKISTHRIQSGEQMGSSTPTRALADAYRYVDGLPIEKSPYHKPRTTTLTEFENRDIRMDATIFNKKHIFVGGLYVPGFGFTSSGYTYRKYFNYEPDYRQDFSFLDHILIRYAEVLLTYAEAKFELNSNISDADLDKSINLVRARAKMPPLTNSFIATNGLDMRTEIRTERRVELAMEGGHRYWDLIRWKTAEIELPKPTLGVKLLPKEHKNISAQLVINSDSIVVVQDASKRSFNPQRDYLWPLPTRDLGLNLNLTQNPKW